MDSRQYIALATKTESVPAELKINQTILHAALSLAIATGAVMDQVKRRLYYGDKSPLTLAKLDGSLQQILNMAQYIGATVQQTERNAQEAGVELHLSEVNQPIDQEVFDTFNLQPEIAGMKLSNLNIRLLHAAIGGFTENGEKLEALLKQYETGVLDLVNFGEESGDSQWYGAIEIDELQKAAAAAGLNPADFTEPAIRVKNITKLQGNEKLKGRYSQGDFDAVAALNRDLANERAVLEASVEQKAA